MAEYEAIPLTATPERAEIVSKILRQSAAHDTIFTDYQRACEDKCFDCDRCLTAIRTVARRLSNPNAMAWEVWKLGEVDLVGILYVTRVNPGVDAEAHYVFFDGKLADKTELIERVINWTFSEHGDWWEPLQRLTVKVPEFAFALARHAHKRLGFGGPIEYEHGDTTIEIEGRKRNAGRWRGDPVDKLILGRLNE